jgi:membrane protease YdiL (CAAX protease family)
MRANIDTRRITWFVLIAFGIAWLVALIIFLTGGLAGNLFAPTLIAVFYMSTPALAHVLTRLITREGWHNVYLRPYIRRGWPYWLACWVAPAILTIVGILLFFAIYPQYYDPALGNLQKLLGDRPSPMPLWTLVVAQIVQAILIAPLINGIFTLGEEFGWRAYLLPKLMPLGGRRAVLISGVIWGVWHWPLIAMGHNYGLDYTGYPWAGLLMMVWFTVIIGIFLSWATLRAGSVWPAVIGHAAINGIAALGTLLLKGEPNPLLGPYPTGLIASLGFALVALILYFSPRALRPPITTATTPEAAPAITPVASQ